MTIPCSLYFSKPIHSKQQSSLTNYEESQDNEEYIQ